MDFLKAFQHLLPTGKAWRIIIDKFLRQYFVGLSNVMQSARDFIDNIYFDLDPQKTREIDQWEQQWALRSGSLTLQERRDRMDGQWKALGGQDPRYIEDTLRAAGFDVYVHEWWEPIIGRPGGGSVDGDVTPVVRNPFTYLNDGSAGFNDAMVDGVVEAQDGDPEAQDGGTLSAALGYPLVNKIVVTQLMTDGVDEMQDGDPLAQDGGALPNFVQRQYFIPTDPDFWPFFLYIGGQNFPDQANVLTSRREEFEELCLKICPTEQWLGILVTYT